MKGGHRARLSQRDKKQERPAERAGEGNNRLLAAGNYASERNFAALRLE
jgi:hypothetical protein